MEPAPPLRCTPHVLLPLALAAAALNPWAPLHRPLHLPAVAAGAPCPVSAPHRLAAGRLRVVGRGPAFALPTPFSAYDRLPGWLGTKTLWAWRPALKTHRVRVLVRGRRLDAPGELRFQLGPDWSSRATRELRLDTTQTVGSFSDLAWGTTVTMLLVRSPGCYGLQLDTAAGTSTVVLAAK